MSKQTFPAATFCLAAATVALAVAATRAEELPHGAVARWGGTPHRAPGGVTAMAYSPDGRLLAASGSSFGVMIWDAQTGTFLKRLESVHNRVGDVFFTSDGKRLVAGGGGMRAWKVSDWSITDELPARPTRGERQAALARLRGEKYIVLLERGAVSLRSSAGNGEEEVLRVSIGNLHNGVVSPDSKLFAVNGSNTKTKEGRVEVWDIATREKRFEFSPLGTRCYTAHFTPDSKTLMAHFSGERKIHQWDMTTGEEGAVIDIAMSPPPVFSPDGRRVAICSDGRTYVYERATGERLTELASEQYVAPKAFSPDGKRLATSKGSLVKVFDVATGKRVFPREDQMLLATRGYSLSRDERRLATYSGSQLVIWDLATEQPMREYSISSFVDLIRFSPKEDYIALGGKAVMVLPVDGIEPQSLLPQQASTRYVAVTSADADAMAEVESSGLIRVRPLGTPRGKAPQAKLALQGHLKSTTAIAFSPDRTRLASCGGDKTIRVWSLASGERIQEIRLKDAPDPCAALSPDAALVAGAVGDRVRVWNVASGELQTIMLVDGPVRSLVFSPDGKQLVSGSLAGELRVFDIRDGKLLRQEGTGKQSISILRYTPDGKSLCVGRADGALELWNPADFKRTARLEGLAGEPRCLAFPPDSGRMAAGDARGVVAVWELKTGKRLNRFTGNGGPIHILAFNREGTTVTCRNRTTYSRLDLATNNLASGRFSVTVTGEKRLPGFAFSPDGKTLATANPSAVRLWDLESKKYTDTLLTPADCSAELAYSPTGDVLAAAWHGFIVFRLDEDSQPMYIDEKSSGETLSLAFTPDGRTLATAGREKEIKLWDVATGSLLHTLGLRRHLYDRRMSFSADGRVLFAYDRDYKQPPGRQTYLTMWETASGRQLAERSLPLKTYSFTADRRRLISGADDGSYLVWDLHRFQAELLTSEPDDPVELETLWTRLAHEDPRIAYRAIGALASQPAEATALIKGRLKPVESFKNIRREDVLPLVERLLSDNLAARREASAELRRLGPAAHDALRLVLNTNKNLTAAARNRIKILLASQVDEGPVEEFQDLRAIYVLERIGSPEAVEILESLAAGARHGRQTEEARHALRRLKVRPEGLDDED